MGQVDTGLRFGRYNSYEMAAGEELWSSKFDVDLYSHIAVQLQAIRPANTATGQLIMRWIKADGSKLSDSTKNISITTKWTRETWILEVPENAKSAMWAVKNTHGSRAWNWACGMVEPGPIAGAFDPALANQVSLLTAAGLYTGTVTANQVVAGILQSLDGKAFFDLEKPEIVMQGDDATWKASPENPLILTDKEGRFLGGLVKQGERVFLASSGLATNENPIYTVKIGDVTYLDESLGAGLYVFDDGGGNEPVVAIETMGTLQNSRFFVKTNKSQIGLSDDELLPAQFFVTHADGTKSFDLGLDPALGFWLFVGNGVNNMGLEGNFTNGIEIQFKNHAIGVDSTGPYYIKSGTKKYLT